MPMNVQQRLIVVVLLGLTILLGVSTYSYRQKYLEVKQDPQKVTQESVNQLLAEVGQLIALPEGETPTVATVSDPSKLKDQPFFAKAKVGDKVLIYTNARKAILYSPTEHKIIEVAPISIGENQPAPAPAN